MEFGCLAADAPLLHSYVRILQRLVSWGKDSYRGWPSHCYRVPSQAPAVGKQGLCSRSHVNDVICGHREFSASSLTSNGWFGGFSVGHRLGKRINICKACDMHPPIHLRFKNSPIIMQTFDYSGVM